jgi:hypothetical protein
MAIYSVTTSGVLQFAYTGLGNPVSTLTSEGISTNALASSPIAGNNPKIWTIGPPNYFTSSGGLVVVDYNGGTQSGLSASSIGEYPLSGIVDNIPEVYVYLGFVTAAEESHGNLVITGNSTDILVYNRTTDGNLILSGNSVYSSLRNELTDGNLVLSGNSVYPSLRNELTDGNLLINTTDAYSIKLKETTAGNLVIDGTDFVQKVYNKTSSGNLVISTSSVSHITLNELSTGNLIVVDKGYNTLYTGGIADNPIASFPIAAGSNSATVTEVQISFYGSVESNGNLVITPVGEFVESLSNSGVIAGAALADQTIGGGMDTIFRSTGYQTTLDFLSNGNLLISGSSGFNNDYQSSGNLLISGTDDAHRALSFNTSGNLVINGSISQSSLRNEDTNGNLVITPIGEFIEPLSDSSGIAGAAIADIPIGGGSDTTYSPTTYEDLWIVESSGNLLISGYSGFNNDYTSQGNLLISGTTVVARELDFLSNGNLVVTGSSYQNRTIAEYSDGNLVISGTTDFSNTLDFLSDGNLLISGSDIGVRILNFITTGNLVMSGNTVVARELDFLSHGNLVITGTYSQSSTFNEDSSGDIVVDPYGQYTEPLSDSSGIAGAAIADIPIGGGKDTNYYSSRYEDIWAPESNGNLVITGYSGFNNDYQSRGNLVISGTTVVARELDFLSSGNLVITGSDSQNRTIAEYSDGNLVIDPIGEFIEPLSDSSGIAGAAIADIPIGGGSDTTYSPTTYEDLWNEDTSGNLTLVGTDTQNSLRTELSQGNLVVNGTDTQSSLRNETTNGNLVIIGNTVTDRTLNFASSGELSFTPVGWKSTADISGTIAGSAMATTPIGGDEMENNISVVQVSYISGGTYYPGNVAYTVTNGNLLITGTDTVELIHAGEVTSQGNLVITGSTVSSVTQISISSGELLISGNSTVNSSVIYPETTTGLVLISGNTISETTYTSDSNGNLLISGYSGQGYTFTTSGNLLISGTTVVEFLPANLNIHTSGNLVISGSTTIEVIIVPPITKQNAGGSYVFASSWDILKPYFPDDRHILGYVRGETEEQPRRRKISGSTGFTVIRGTPKTQPKFGFLKDIANIEPKQQVTLVPKVNENKFLKQIMLEDEMLLNGSLISIDDPDDELERELMR